MLNPFIIEAINKTVPWQEQETDIDGYRVSDPTEALANIRGAIKCIVEFDGDPNDVKKSTSDSVGDLSCILDSIPLELEYAAQLFLSFTLRASNRPEEVDPTSRNNLQHQEIYEVVGLAGICGQHMYYQREIWENQTSGDKYPYSGRIIRLKTSDYEKIFW